MVFEVHGVSIAATYLTLPIQQESSRRHYKNKFMWQSSNMTLFMNDIFFFMKCCAFKVFHLFENIKNILDSQAVMHQFLVITQKQDGFKGKMVQHAGCYRPLQQCERECHHFLSNWQFLYRSISKPIIFLAFFFLQTNYQLF